MVQKLKTQSSKLKAITQILKVLRFLVVVLTFNICVLSLPTTVYATSPPPCNPAIPGHCPAGLQQIEDIVRSIITAVVGLGFIAMLVMLIMAGIKYLTSGGEPKAVQAAHLTLTWALLGILFFAVAWLILQLIHAFTGIDVTVFDIKALCGPGNKWCKP